MGAAVAVHDAADRPGWLEKLLVLCVCGGLVFGLAKVDERAARREAAKARVVLAERAERAAQRASREAMTAPVAPVARTERLGRDSSPIVIPAGPAWGPGTSVVSHTRRSEAPPPGAVSTEIVLRRVQGPRGARDLTAIPEPAAPVTIVSAAAPAPLPRDDRQPLLLALMGALGLSLVGGGLRLVSRRSA